MWTRIAPAGRCAKVGSLVLKSSSSLTPVISFAEDMFVGGGEDVGRGKNSGKRVYRIYIYGIRPWLLRNFLSGPKIRPAEAEAENWDDATIWFPAEFVDFDLPRKCQEYQFKWNESIAWSAGTPDDLCFYRAAKHWEHVEAFLLRLKDAQEVTDSTPALDPLLAKIFKLAVNPVVCLLVNLDTENEVIKSYSDYYKENSSDSAKNTFRWIECYHIPRNPALEAMLESPIEETARSKILKRALTGPETMKRVSAAGALLLQLLAVQHNLGETLNLNSDMFSRIKTGHLRTSTPASSKAMSAMAARAQPLKFEPQKDG
ncbi:hypothetical protein GGX14DRAFT_390321 [Mycena pura]|uniref:Uncharacterized protein n=1 Tax=Mycena pura TaxID=153505 RepID=A0AAD6VPW1_9AGAR|nr:hypothetical protein GGX14DRAFT_390321 [Mycena pura]